jgi:hypothetical protein
VMMLGAWFRYSPSINPAAVAFSPYGAICKAASQDHAPQLSSQYTDSVHGAGRPARRNRAGACCVPQGQPKPGPANTSCSAIYSCSDRCGVLSKSSKSPQLIIILEGPGRALPHRFFTL